MRSLPSNKNDKQSRNNIAQSKQPTEMRIIKDFKRGNCKDVPVTRKNRSYWKTPRKIRISLPSTCLTFFTIPAPKPVATNIGHVLRLKSAKDNTVPIRKPPPEMQISTVTGLGNTFCLPSSVCTKIHISMWWLHCFKGMHQLMALCFVGVCDHNLIMAVVPFVNDWKILPYKHLFGFFTIQHIQLLQRDADTNNQAFYYDDTNSKLNNTHIKKYRESKLICIDSHVSPYKCRETLLRIILLDNTRI
uniref:Uncharacterized protein n=1 Tax=Glossina brevipalpis TaxID=37001 RepID=A0A1A9W2P9_9MUSC